MSLFAAAALVTPVDTPGFPVSEKAAALPDGTFELTVDVRDAEAAVGLDLNGGKAVAPGLEAELIVRRYVFQVPGGAVDLGAVPLSTATIPSDAVWTQDTEIDGILQNVAMARWYDYGYTSHLLSTKGHTYALRSRSGETIYLLTIVSYYCEPEGSGCLTVRYRFGG